MMGPIPTTLPALPVLGRDEQRVLGCLLEKQLTVPASYPLSLKALRLACNQSSSRDPVLDLDERAVETAARALREFGLAQVGWADTGRRTRKYSQTATEALHLPDDERALLTVLLLRGAQTAGELNSRTDRLHPFHGRDEVEQCLTRMAGRSPALVRQLERRPGQHDQRWVHLLGAGDPGADPDDASGTSGEPWSGGLGSGGFGTGGSGTGGSGAGGERSGGSAAGSPRDRESALRDGATARDDRVRAVYTAAATQYADRLHAELDDLPFERWLLDRVAAEVIARPDGEPVVDVGCGPGHVTAYLAATGLDAGGIDLVPAMVEQARDRHPQLRFEVGDLFSLMRPPAATGWGAVLAWYSLIHLAGSELTGALAALARPLAPGGLLVLALHAGRGVRRLPAWIDGQEELEILLHTPDDVLPALTAAGVSDVEWYRRGPIAARGESTERLYLIGRRG